MVVVVGDQTAVDKLGCKIVPGEGAVAARQTAVGMRLHPLVARDQRTIGVGAEHPGTAAGTMVVPAYLGIAVGIGAEPAVPGIAVGVEAEPAFPDTAVGVVTMHAYPDNMDGVVTVLAYPDTVVGVVVV